LNLLVATFMNEHPPVLDAVSTSTGCTPQRKETLNEIVELAVEIAREGREGRRIGTLFVIGDVEETLARSRQLILDPLAGHPRSALHVDQPEFRETVKELAQLDGAFIVDDDGAFVSASRYVDIDIDSTFLAGLGTRHAAGLSISRATTATAVVVSQSAVVRVFSRGKLKAEIIPELFLMSRERLFAPDAAVQRVPELGLTVALADADAAA
jgi:DNA integrity scanning protein DisA with diadenylate cyclase activity